MEGYGDGDGGGGGGGGGAGRRRQPSSDVSSGRRQQMSTDSFFMAKRHIYIHLCDCVTGRRAGAEGRGAWGLGGWGGTTGGVATRRAQ